ncbi:FAD-dependent oxidoreductase [Citricoccus nitrophenolicus]
MTSFPHVFSPLTIGGKQLKNRLVALPAGTSIAEKGVPTPEDAVHFERLAAGGVAMIVTGATIAHPSSGLRSRKLVEAYLDEVVPAMEHKAEVVHKHGALLIGQLIHLGREFIGGESDYAPRAPSMLKTPRDAYPPHELTRREILEIVKGFRISTAHLVQAGVDGIEIHAAHGYLVAQFMSELTNHRTDEFGGPFENRMRFLNLVMSAIRSELPEGAILGVRLSGEEEIPGGMDIEDACRIAETLAATGQVDYFSVTHGVRGGYVKDSTQPDGVAIPSASRIRAATGLPVLVGQRIRDVDRAENALKQGHADLVGMARALLADPELPNKSRQGRLTEIRGCLGINQDCRAFDPHLHCAVNAEIGRTRPASVDLQVERPREISIIGGGIAGMEAARVAAGRGHRVTIYERTTSLGGSVRIASQAPYRSSLEDIVGYLTREMVRLKVTVHLGAEIGKGDLADVVEMSDHVIVATGSRPTPPPVYGNVPVRTVDEVITAPAADLQPGTAVVYDEGDGFWPPYNAAERLVLLGWKVVFATPLGGIASRVPHESIGPLLSRLGEAGTRFLPLHSVAADDGDPTAIRLAPVFGGEPEVLRPDLVVWHRHRTPNAELPLAAEELDRDSISLIGDCMSPRRIGHAISEGYKIGASV